jgi:hypothetical protein
VKKKRGEPQLLGYLLALLLLYCCFTYRWKKLPRASTPRILTCFTTAFAAALLLLYLQVEKSAASLNSSDAFVLCSQNKVLIWYSAEVNQQ